jgi:hypothetical protein
MEVFTTTSAAVFTANPRARAGMCPISRKCFTTTGNWWAGIWTLIRSRTTGSTLTSRATSLVLREIHAQFVQHEIVLPVDGGSGHRLLGGNLELKKVNSKTLQQLKFGEG